MWSLAAGGVSRSALGVAARALDLAGGATCVIAGAARRARFTPCTRVCSASARAGQPRSQRVNNATHGNCVGGADSSHLRPSLAKSKAAPRLKRRRNAPSTRRRRRLLYRRDDGRCSPTRRSPSSSLQRCRMPASGGRPATPPS
eukprot:4783055-Pyramimonas_sp.AAC.1